MRSLAAAKKAEPKAAKTLQAVCRTISLRNMVNNPGQYSEGLSPIRMVVVVQWISLFPGSYWYKVSSPLSSETGKLCSKIVTYGNCCLNVPFLTWLVISVRLEMA